MNERVGTESNLNQKTNSVRSPEIPAQDLFFSLLVCWYFEPSQPQQITSGLKQTSISLLFTLHTCLQTTNYPKTTKSVLSQIYIKQSIHKYQTKFSKNYPFSIAPVKKKKHIRLGHAGIVDHSVNLSTPDV